MNKTIGLHCSHEIYSPSQLRQFATQACAAGFNHGMCSDHFHPWTPSQGHSGFAWSWLGAAMQSTSLTMGMV